MNGTSRNQGRAAVLRKPCFPGAHSDQGSYRRREPRNEQGCMGEQAMLATSPRQNEQVHCSQVRSCRNVPRLCLRYAAGREPAVFLSFRLGITWQPSMHNFVGIHKGLQDSHQQIKKNTECRSRCRKNNPVQLQFFAHWQGCRITDC